MAERSLAHILTFGLFERQLPDFDKPMWRIAIELKHLDVPENQVRALANSMMGENGVAPTENFLDYVLEHAGSYGSFHVYVQEEGVKEFTEKYMEKNIVADIHDGAYCGVSKRHLKEIFPEEFESRFFCPDCDYEKKEENDPCGNNSGTCQYGNMAHAKMAETNQKLQAMLDAVNKDVEEVAESDSFGLAFGSIAVPAPVSAKTPFHYECPCCAQEYPSNTYIDCDGDIDCGNCDYGYFGAEENKHYEN